MEKTTLTYQCPNCNAPLEFDPKKNAFVCNFCISSFSEELLLEMEKEKLAKQERGDEEEELETDAAQTLEEGYEGEIPDMEEAEFSDEVSAYTCPNCGAEVIADRETAATVCYFCHSPVVLSERVGGLVKPQKIVPFKIDKQTAKETFLSFVKKKWFVPRDYFCDRQIENISGVYFPFWVTDADTDSEFESIAHRVRTWRQGDYMYTETRNYLVRRRGRIHFEDIVTSALSTEDKKMLEGILPFPSDTHEDFKMPYLLGFSAKKRDINRDAVVPEVRKKMHDYSRTLLRNTVIGYTSVDFGTCRVRETGSHWEYTLMPVWILTYKNKKGKTFLYAMNGYTGKLYGQLPVSLAKLAALFAAIFAAALPIIALILGGG